MPRRLIAAAALLWCSQSYAAPWPPADRALLHNARFWEAHDRGDLAQLALRKLVAARPDQPEPLVQLGELDLRLNDFHAAAEVDTELGRRFAGSAAARDFATEMRIATRDRLRFASIRRLFEINRVSEASTELEHLFPQGAPGGTLGIEYCLMLARTPGGGAAARAGLERLAHSHAGDPRYRLALAQLLVRQSDTAAEGVRLVNELTQRDDVRRDDADRVLASGLLRLGPERAPEGILRAYLARNPQDTELVTLRREQQHVREERGLEADATAAQVLPVLQKRIATDLSAGAVPAALRIEVRTWLDRSRASVAVHHERRAAAELRAALAFEHRQYESAIAVSKVLDAQGEAAEADELLRSAARLDPRSTWLFETYVRRLLARGDCAAAIELLRGHALTGKWTAAARDALLASAFEQRAAEGAKSGSLAAAAADLEAALPLAPRDAWLRYRLAGYYRDRGETTRGSELMRAGLEAAPYLPEMHYALALYLSQIEEYAQALAAVEAIDPAQRTEGMNALDERMRVLLARDEARRLKGRGDVAGARTVLLAVEPVALRSFDRARDLAFSWIELGDREHGFGLVQPYLSGSRAEDPEVLLSWAELLNSADDDVRLEPVLAKLRTMPQLGAVGRADLRRLERAHELRVVRALERQKDYAAAERRLNALLAAEPQDRKLRVARAELDLMEGRPRAACDRLASLVAEDPDDLDTRLTYVRALTDSGNGTLARAQLRAVEARLPGGDEELQVSLARRQLALGEAAQALRTLAPLLAVAQPRADVLVLAGRATLAQGHLGQARDYFERAAATGPEALEAHRAREKVDERLESSVTAGLIGWHQPGDPGMSQLDLYTLPSAWVFARDDGSRLIARADAVVLDAGRFSSAAGAPLLLGTLPAAGPGAVARYASERQAGLSPAIDYENHSLAFDIGAAPLGFLVTNVVGGVEWTPKWRSLDLTFGVARRAVTSSELSYSGLRDPVTGATWGGVVQTGPYAGFGVYRESYSISGSVRLQELTGTHVSDNQLAAAHWGSSWKFWSMPDLRADAGVTVDYWNYQHNLQNYTFGSGGYYSPHSYLSVSIPIELEGERMGWRYKARLSPSYGVSRVNDEPFFPNDAALQAAAGGEPLPAGFSSPVFPGYHSSGFGFAAYAAGERKLSDALVVGVLIDINRTDYYHPTSVGVYLRHAFGVRPTQSSTLRPLRPYNH